MTIANATLNANYIFTSLIITVIVYVGPAALIRISGPRNRKKSHRIALSISIIVGLTFIAFRLNIGISATSSVTPVFYYFINKNLLNAGYHGPDEDYSTKGSTVFQLKDLKSDEHESRNDDKQTKNKFRIINTKSKENDNSPSFNSLQTKVAKVIFPGGASDFESVMKSMQFIFNDKFDEKKLIEIYTRVSIRLMRNSPEEVVKRIIEFDNLDISKERIIQLVSYVVYHKLNNTSVLTDNETLKMVDFFSNQLKNNETFIKINTEHFSDLINDSDYGRNFGKPIYVNGQQGTRLFLNTITNSVGETFNYIREGSQVTDKGSVDKYVLENTTTKEKHTIFINMYSANLEYFPPKGFLLKKESQNEIIEDFSKNEVVADFSTNIILENEEKNLEDNFGASFNDINNDNQEHKNKKEVKLMSEIEINEELATINNKTDVKYDRKCPSCGYICSNDSEYCNQCGTKILVKIYCSNCGVKLEANAKFCHKCGQEI